MAYLMEQAGRLIPNLSSPTRNHKPNSPISLTSSPNRPNLPDKERARRGGPTTTYYGPALYNADLELTTPIGYYWNRRVASLSPARRE